MDVPSLWAQATTTAERVGQVIFWPDQLAALHAAYEADQREIERLTRERDEYKHVAAYAAGDPEEVEITRRAMQTHHLVKRRAEAAEARVRELEAEVAALLPFAPGADDGIGVFVAPKEGQT